MCHHYEGDREAALEAMRDELGLDEASDDATDDPADVSEEAEEPSVEVEPTPADD